MSFKKYVKAERYLNEGLIRTSVTDTPGMPTRREWMLKFLDDLGHPEQAFPAIHIAGTSGKGSTAIMIAEMLRTAGHKVGLHTTPYLQVATEKLWYDGRYASAEEFIDLVEWIKPICEKWRGPEVPLHGMASFGICLEYFRRKKVDIAVIEAGVGGRDDLTNVLKTKLSVITPIGIDHTKTLGDTIESIAAHKAGIIKREIPVVAHKGAGHQIISETAKEKNAPITWIEPNKSTDFQTTNVKLASSAMLHFVPDPKCNICRLPGRMERLQENPTAIIDGAHNAQKLRALFETVSNSAVVIYGTIKNKLCPDIIDILRNLSGRLIITTPRVYGKEAMYPHDLARLLEMDNIIVEPNPKDALEFALEISRPADTVLVAGSLYLAGNIRELYYPSPEIVEQRTSWPT